MEPDRMNGRIEAEGRAKTLIELIFCEYEKDRKQDRLSYRIFSFFRRLFNKEEEIPLTHGGYLEDEESVRILESLKSKEISAPDDKVLIVSREGVVYADIKGTFVYISGEVHGDIAARHVYVKGLAEGDIKAAHVEIFTGGEVSGHVETSRLLLHKKGVLRGQCDIN
ncbi:MAG TPA: polymer-forming cytoskeletal protein [Firmicutes bacterium]|nr:polymer-forming cytoskeletal protein [Bacillota bacterium]